MKNKFFHYVDDFEKEAEEFLEKYECSNVIENPCRVPIHEIATKLMSLKVIQSECLSPDESVQGAIIFSKGIIDVYDWTTHKYVGYGVETPSIFIDSDIINIGRINNTIAHECYHWWRHRNYFNYKRTYEKSLELGFRCNKIINKKPVSPDLWTDVEKMEWQARTIAPKILMPRIATRNKIERLYKNEYEKHDTSKDYVVQSVISKLAEFYAVSKQSAAIRMVELGYKEASKYTTVDEPDENSKIKGNCFKSMAVQRQKAISLMDAYKLFCDNENFRTTINTGAFCFADGYFVIFNKQFVIKNDDGIWHLTYYAKEHLSLCTLDVSIRLVEDRSGAYDEISHLMYRADSVFKKKASFDANTQNTEIFNKAKEFENQFKRSKKNHKTSNEMLWDYMREAHWNTYIFTMRTELNEMNYSRVQKPDYKFAMMPLVSMGIGLQLTLTEMNEVLSCAGLSFNYSDKKEQAYQYLFTGMYGKTISECNDFLEQIGVPKLGSKHRKKDW